MPKTSQGAPLLSVDAYVRTLELELVKARGAAIEWKHKHDQLEKAYTALHSLAERAVDAGVDGFYVQRLEDENRKLRLVREVLKDREGAEIDREGAEMYVLYENWTTKEYEG